MLPKPGVAINLRVANASRRTKIRPVRFSFPACAVAVSLSLLAASQLLAAASMPAALSDQEFWSLVVSFSEPAGSFLSENLVSNESHLAEMIHAMGPQHRGGTYIGVGPEQNFSYIARLQPQLAFIVDIRGENRDLQLMYKALFEISDNRPDFVSRLFSRRRPAGLRSDASAEEIFDTLSSEAPDHALYVSTLHAVRDRLLSHHHLPLSAGQLQWIEHVLSTFYAEGPTITYWGTPVTVDLQPGTREVRERIFSYAGLMTAKDETRQVGSYLASERRFRIVKDLESNNLIVPIVGDFAGDKALTSVGRYVREHGGNVSLFYGSNVADILTPEQFRRFCGNLALLRDATGPDSLYIGGEVGDVINNAFEGFALFSKAIGNCAR